jgi:teichuronic acid exporter
MSDSLMSKAAGSLFWSAIERNCERGIQFIVSIVLARILAPEQFGIIAMLTVFIALARTVVDSGFAAALIQKKDVTHVDECSIFYFNIFFGVLMAGFLWLAAPWLAAFYEVPLLTPVTRVMSLKLISSSFGIVHVTLLNRQLDFKTQVKARMISVVGSGAVGVIMANYGYGVWSLVGQQLSASVLNSIALWIVCSWRPSLIFSVRALRSMFGFGSKLLVSSLIDTVFRNIYMLVIGKLFLPAQLGYFGRAQSLQRLPAVNIFYPFKRVMFPMFSQISDDKRRLKEVMQKTLVTLAMINFPLMIGLALVAKPLVLVVLTEKWLACVPYLQLLCISSLLYPLHLVNVNVLKAKGRSDLFLRLEVIKKVLTVVAILVTYRWGILALIGGQIVQSVCACYINTYYSAKLLDYPFREQSLNVLPYFFTALLMGSGIHALRFIGIDNHLSLLLVQVGAGLLLYPALCYLLRLSAFTYAIDTARPYANRFFKRFAAA